jgi:very-short-patch-repair endonuclease
LRLSVGMRRELATDHAIAVIADRQGGTIARAQLTAVGLSAQAIDRRLRTGRLHPLHRGVFSVGHRVVGVVGRRWAAVLASGPGAVLSHWSAGAAWDIRASRAATVDVTVGLGGRARRPGIRLHRSRSLPPDDVTELRGLPITTPARTLLDLAAGGLRGRPLEAAVDSAERRRLLDFAELHELLARYPSRPGSPSLKAVLSRYSYADTRSELEELVLELCDRHGLPRPQVNCVIEGKVRDFYWPHAGLVVEADSYGWHRSPSALNDDRERDVELTLAGYRSLRFTWHQVTRRREYVAGALLRALLRLDLA